MIPMPNQPRTFGDGGGVSRRDHAVRTANTSNSGLGGLSAIDAALAGNSRAKIGKVDHLSNMFATMDQRRSGDKRPADPYDAAFHPSVINTVSSDGEADSGLSREAHDPLTTRLSHNNLKYPNNIEAAAYHERAVGTPIPFGATFLEGGGTTRTKEIAGTGDPADDPHKRYQTTGTSTKGDAVNTTTTVLNETAGTKHTRDSRFLSGRLPL